MHQQGGHGNGSSGAVVVPLPVCAPEDEFAACFAGGCRGPPVSAWNTGTDELVLRAEIAIRIGLSSEEGALEWLH